MWCKYKDILGKPGKGVHQYRIFNIAIVDLSLTIILAIVLSMLLNTTFWITLFFTILLGIVFHKLFCVQTTVHKLIFDS
jgi:hypothetical protein